MKLKESASWVWGHRHMGCWEGCVELFWIYTPGASGSNSRKQRTVICYNCKREGHMFKQCTKPKRNWDDAWFKDKVLLVQAQANGEILHEEELAILAYPGIVEGQATQTVITHNAAYQADDWMHMTLIVMNPTLPKLLSW
nr:hypothetical protein [Tanacetum cinerariifolium]